MFTGYEFRQEPFLLLIRTPPPQLIHAKIRMRAIRKTDRRRRPADFFHCYDMCEVPEAGATQLIFNGNSQQSQTAKFRPKITRELIRFINLCSARSNAVEGSGTNCSEMLLLPRFAPVLPPTSISVRLVENW